MIFLCNKNKYFIKDENLEYFFKNHSKHNLRLINEDFNGKLYKFFSNRNQLYTVSIRRWNI